MIFNKIKSYEKIWLGFENRRKVKQVEGGKQNDRIRKNIYIFIHGVADC